MNRYLRNGSIVITPVEGIRADKSLVRTKFLFDYIIPSYDTMIKDLSVWMNSHGELYPHYINQ